MPRDATSTEPPRSPLPGPASTGHSGDPEVLATLRRGRRRPGRWLLAGALAVGAVGLSLWAFWPTQPGQARWEVAPVQTGDLVVRVTAVGMLEAVDSVEVGSDLSGRVQAVSVEVNQRVKAGDELARIEPDRYRNAVAQARAAVAQARAALAQAKVQGEARQLEWTRADALYRGKAIPAAEHDGARLARDAQLAAVLAAEAGVAAAVAGLDRAQEDLDDSVIVSPIDGVVTQRLVDPGQTVVSSLQATPLFEVASDLAAMTAAVDVDEADIGRVAAGQPATFTVSAWPDRQFDAVVHAVDIAPDPRRSVVVYGAELRLDNTDGALRPGMTATAEIEVGRLPDATLVPSAALRYSPRTLVPGGAMVAAPSSGPRVFVLVDDAPIEVPVQVLGTDGTLTAIRGDLPAGAVVVLSETGR